MKPNPIKYRESTVLMNDGWDFSLNGEDWQSINVPYCPQSKLSGVAYEGMIRQCFYRKTIHYEPSDDQVLIHFGAVDYRAILSINGNYVGAHTGGFTPFEFDIKSYLVEGANTVLLTVYDENFNIPSGKQTYKEKSFGCFYTRTTGIWQPVWLEYVPQERIRDFCFYPHVEECSVGIDLWTHGEGCYDIKVFFEGQEVGHAAGEIAYRAKVEIPLSEKHLWDVGQGNLYDVTIGFEKDAVQTYFGLREVTYAGNRFLINGKEVFQKLVLNQGYYPEGLYTAATDEERKRDIDLAIKLGFNGSRLHQKVFDPRFLYFCDKAGHMVWGEFPSWGIDYSTMDSLGQFLNEWQETMKRDFNHPSIIHWCPLNEVWGDVNLPKKKPDMRIIRLIYQYTKEYDPTRPCVDVSGGYHSNSTDLFDFHCYESTGQIQKYLSVLEMHDRIEDPLGACEGLSTPYVAGQPVNLSEYGGFSFGHVQECNDSVSEVNEGAVQSESSWGYGRGETDGDAFVDRFCVLTSTLLNCKKLSGYCYTQLYDIEQEVNGFYYYDRSDKLTEEQKKRIFECQSKR